MNSQSGLAKKVETNRDLLIAALNKNQVSFAQIAKSAESISSGVLKLKLDSGGKVFVFEYLGKKVVLEMNELRLRGLNYLNDILIDDILTKVELDEVYRILEEVQNELLNKADKEHTHEIEDINNLQNELNDKADKEHTHTSFGTLNITKLNTNEINGNASNSLSRIRTIRSNYTARLELAVDTTSGRIGDIIISQYDAYFKNIKRSATLLDASGNTSFPGTLTASNVKADNESRLQTVESGLNDKAPIDHTHTHFDNDITINRTPFELPTDGKYIIERIEFTNNNPSFFSCTSTINENKATITIYAYTLLPNFARYKISIDSGKYEPIVSNAELNPYESTSRYELPIFLEKYKSIYTPVPYVENDNITINVDWSSKTNTDYESFTFIIKCYKTTDSNEIPIEYRIYCNMYFKKYIDVSSVVNNSVPTTQYLVDWLYPVGSIYLSMNNVDPSKIFGGTWEQIKQNFLLCTTAYSSKTTGGSSYITEKQLPPHRHTITNIQTESAGTHSHDYAVSDDRNGFPDGSSDTSGGTSAKESYWRGNKYLSNNRTSTGSGEHTHTINGETDSCGEGEPYFPLFMTCYGWYRTA